MPLVVRGNASHPQFRARLNLFWGKGGKREREREREKTEIARYEAAALVQLTGRRSIITDGGRVCIICGYLIY